VHHIKEGYQADHPDDRAAVEGGIIWYGLQCYLGGLKPRKVGGKG